MANHRSIWDLRETRTERVLRRLEEDWRRWTPAQRVAFTSLLACAFGGGLLAAGEYDGGVAAICVAWLLSVLALGVPR